MPKIERRHVTVPLYQGNTDEIQAELAELLERVIEARENEQQQTRDDEPAGPPLRAGEKPAKPESMRLAEQYDTLLEKSRQQREEIAVKVDVWELDWDEWGQLADQHPPRDDIPADEEAGTPAKSFPEDKKRGLNTSTFPPALLRVALVDPSTPGVSTVEEKHSLGAAKLAELGPSRVQYVKLETAAWNVNVSDDALPKSSLVSLLKAQRDPDSGQLSELE